MVTVHPISSHVWRTPASFTMLVILSVHRCRWSFQLLHTEHSTSLTEGSVHTHVHPHYVCKIRILPFTTKCSIYVEVNQVQCTIHGHFVCTYVHVYTYMYTCVVYVHVDVYEYDTCIFTRIRIVLYITYTRIRLYVHTDMGSL